MSIWARDRNEDERRSETTRMLFLSMDGIGPI